MIPIRGRGFIDRGSGLDLESCGRRASASKEASKGPFTPY